MPHAPLRPPSPLCRWRAPLVPHHCLIAPPPLLQVEGNPFLEGQGAARSVAGILVHLGGLKDLDGPISAERNRRAREVGEV